MMIKREQYMRRIRPFIGNDPIKVLTGIRGSGKSVMLDLIKEELIASGISDAQFITFNFEAMKNAHLCTAEALYREIIQQTTEINGKVYLFFDEIQEVVNWERCINSFRVELDCDIYITGSNAKLLSGELATYLAGRYIEFIIYPFLSGNSGSFTPPYFLLPIRRRPFTNILLPAACPTLPIFAMPGSHAANIWRRSTILLF